LSGRGSNLGWTHRICFDRGAGADLRDCPVTVYISGRGFFWGKALDRVSTKGKLYGEVWVAAFFLLLAVVLLTVFVGRRLVPLLMPSGRRKTITMAWIGGLAGTIIAAFAWESGPVVAGINLIAAFAGSFLFLVIAGLFPFVRIAIGKT